MSCDINYLLETERLLFRELNENDLVALRPILGDIETMYAWEYGFNDEQILGMINRHMERYKKYGFSCNATIEKSTGTLIGIIGVLPEEINGKECIGVGYILGKEYWGRGYAIEASRAWLAYAFDTLNAGEVIADIRPENTASRKVVEKLGMKIVGEITKNVNGKDMVHLIYSKARE